MIKIIGASEITEHLINTLSDSAKDGRIVHPASALPYPTETMKMIIEGYVASIKSIDEAAKFSIRSAYLALATFINDLDAEFYNKIDGKLEKVTFPLSPEIRKLLLGCGHEDSEIDRFEAIFCGVADRTHEFAKEADDLLNNN